MKWGCMGWMHGWVDGWLAGWMERTMERRPPAISSIGRAGCDDAPKARHADDTGSAAARPDLPGCPSSNSNDRFEALPRSREQSPKGLGLPEVVPVMLVMTHMQVLGEGVRSFP